MESYEGYSEDSSLSSVSGSSSPEPLAPALINPDVAVEQIAFKQTVGPTTGLSEILTPDKHGGEAPLAIPDSPPELRSKRREEKGREKKGKKEKKEGEPVEKHEVN